MNAKLEQTPAMNPNPVLSVTKEGTVQYSNEASEPILNEWGVRIGEKLPSSIVDLVQRVISRNSPEKLEVKVGNKVYLVVFHPIPEEECVKVSGFDISDQKIAEEKLRESEDKYKVIFDNSLDGIFFTVPDGTILAANPAACQMFGMTEEELIRAGRNGTVDTSDPRLKFVLEERARAGKFRGELNHRRKDGTIFPSEISSTLFEDKNGLTKVVMVIRDITEREQAEKALRKSEERFRSAFDGSAVAMALVCPDARLFKVNDAFCRMLGFEKSEMESGTFLDFTYPDDMEASILTHKAVMNREKPIFWLEKRYIRKDGRVIWCEVSSSPVLDSKGCPIYTVAHIQDITERKRAEEELRKSENRFRTLAENSPDVIARFDSKNRHIYINPAATVPYGHSQEEIIGKTHTELGMNPKQVKFWETHHDKVFITGKPETMEFQYTSPQGEEYYFNTRIVPEFVDGKVTSVLAISRDITELKEAEAKLKETLDNLEKIVEERTAELEKAYSSLKESKKSLAEAQEMAHIGNWEWDIDTDKAYWSEEMYHIFKRDPQKVAPSLKEYLSYIHPDDLDDYCNATHNTRKVNTSGFDFRIVITNGEERTLHIKSDFIFNDENIPIRVKGIVQDITERKKAEEKLRKSEEKYRNIVETANEGIVVINSEFKLTYVNKKIEDMLGYSSGEIISKSMWDFISEESKPEIKMILERGLQNFENPEIKYVRKDGSTLWAQVNSKPLFDSDGKFKGIMTMLTDITKRKEAEEILAIIETARKKEIHHRIKNNLQVISSLLDLQVEKFNNREYISHSEILQAFKESQDRVISMALIHEELYRGEEIDKINFSQYINELAENLLLTYRVGNDGISLNTDIEEDIFFDIDTAVPLGIIINELVSNSLKYAFSGMDNGEIRINLQREESGECETEGCSTVYILNVSDNGVGISEDLDIEDLDSLGLQLVTTLVAQLDGELELKRDNGTEFIVNFAVIERNNQLSAQALQMVDND